MPPKKKGGPKKASGEPVLGEDPVVLLQQYQRFSRLIGVKPHQQVVAALQDDEHYPVEQLIVNDEHGPLGPGGTRALTTALLGNGPDMKGGPYKLLRSLRLWRAHCGDDGCCSLAEVVRLGGNGSGSGNSITGDARIRLEYLELFDDDVGPKGAAALGRALSVGFNTSLLTLKLDYNRQLGAEGAAGLCRGLRTNSTLKQLHLCYCGIGPEGGESLGNALAYPKSALVVLNIQGNQIGAEGLKLMAPGLSLNPSLEYLCAADNEVGGSEADAAALGVFRDAVVACQTLSHLDLLYNRIGESGARAMLPALALAPEGAGGRIKQLLVDATLPTPVFEALHRSDALGGGKGKGKKKAGSSGGKKKKNS